MQDDTPGSIYDTLFSMQVTLCERFPALTPLQLRREKAREVFLLMSRLIEYAKQENTKNEKTNTNSTVIRKHAGDNWF